MKNQRLYLRLFSTICVLSLFAVQPGFAATKSVIKIKSAGRTANSIPNTILNGFSAPTKSIGINGDFYIDTKNLNIYGPKKNNAWPAAISLRGAEGAAGSDGKTGTPGVAGSDGKTVTNTLSSSGSAGATGATGAAGTIGATGAPGSAGSAGPAGPAGPAGSTGATGAPGTTGTPGTSGVTSVSIGSFTFINPLTGTASSSSLSNSFGNMQAGKKYLMHLAISAVNSTLADFNTTLLLEITSTAGAIPITTSYYSANGKRFATSATRFSQNVFADLVIDGTAVTSIFDLTAKVSLSDSIASTLTLTGYFTLTEVGSIS